MKNKYYFETKCETEKIHNKNIKILMVVVLNTYKEVRIIYTRRY